MDYPMINGKISNYPTRPICPVCKKKKVFEPHSMVVLEGGACLNTKRLGVSGPDKNMEGFLSLHWHGAHDKGQGKQRDVYLTKDLATDVEGGQFEFCFCSIKCLKAWFNKILSDFEEEIKKG